MPRSTSRKRNSPEDVVEPVAGTPESSVRPMYVPSPHKNASGFTPIRRHKTKSMSSVAGAGPAVPSSLRSEVLPEGPALPDGESGSKTRVSSRNFSNPSDLVSALYPDDDRRSPERQERTIQKEANSGHRERALGGTLNDRTNVAGQNQSLGAVASKPSIAHEVTKQPAASDTAAAGQAAGLMARLASIRQGRA